MKMRPSALHRFPLSAIALALAALHAPATAEDDAVTSERSVTFGVGALSGSDADRALSGRYGSLPRDRDYGLSFGIDYRLRDHDSPIRVDIVGNDLLGQQRELDISWRRPGYWRVAASYGELVSRDPLLVNTAMAGFGTTAPQLANVAVGGGSSQALQTRRTSAGLKLSGWFTPDVQAEVELRHERKEGARLFGRGFNCPSPSAPGCAGTTGIATGWAVLMLPEPIDAAHSEVDARVSYAHGPLRASVGYYGSWYRNANSTLTPSIPGSLANAMGTTLPLSAGLQAILSQPMALAPDNQAQQVDFTGSYDLAAHTRATMKLAWSRATQDDSFAGNGLAGAPAGASSLEGKVTTTLARLGLTSRPIPKLFLLGDVRYENRDDNTPVALYNVEGTNTWTNRRLPQRKVRARAEAQWQFTADWRGSVGADHESIDRGVFTPTSAVGGISALRQDTRETGVFAELRKRVSTDVSGALRLARSERDGSAWLADNSGRGVTEVADPAASLPLTAIYMPTLADRQRDKAKLYVDWQVNEDASLQFGVEEGRDRYDQLRGYGLGSTRASQYTVDGSYAINEKWNVTGYASWGRQALNQARPFGAIMAMRNSTRTFGAGFTGKPAGKIEIGANLSVIDDRSAYQQTLDVLAGADSAALLAATGGLPDISYRQTALRVFGKYTIDPKAWVRADIVWQRTSWNEWAWNYNGVPFAYSDGTTVALQPKQEAVYVGVTYRRSF